MPQLDGRCSLLVARNVVSDEAFRLARRWRPCVEFGQRTLTGAVAEADVSEPDDASTIGQTTRAEPKTARLRLSKQRRPAGRCDGSNATRSHHPRSCSRPSAALPSLRRAGARWWPGRATRPSSVSRPTPTCSVMPAAFSLAIRAPTRAPCKHISAIATSSGNVSVLTRALGMKEQDFGSPEQDGRAVFLHR